MDSQNADRLRLVATLLIGLHFVAGVVGVVSGLTKIGSSATLVYGAFLIAGSLATAILGLTIGFGAFCLADIHSHFRRTETPATKPKLATRKVSTQQDQFPEDWMDTK